MLLQGSCHCGAVSFSVESAHPYPYNICYCSICRKTTGGGGFAINLGASSNSMKISGKQHIKTYRAKIENANGGSESPAERKFCEKCASALWVWDPRWPELVHPFASAIDTELPKPPEKTHLMLTSKATWVEPNIGKQDKEFDEYPDESIAEWHQRHGVVK